MPRRSSARIDVGLLLATLWLTLVGLSAALASVLPLGEARDPTLTLEEPIFASPGLFSAHPLGTDRYGLDVLGGLAYGARTSLLVGGGAVLIAVVVGGALGLVSGYFGGYTDTVISTLLGSMMAFPPLILLIALAAVLSPSAVTISAALGFLVIPSFARLVRANTLSYVNREFVVAARGAGARNLRIIRREILPNVAQVLVAYGFTVMSALIVADASLAFLGLGLKQPTPTWGNMIAAGSPVLDSHPTGVLAPGFVLFLTVLSLNGLAEGLARRTDRRESTL